ncbi:hypothetical protein [Pseudooceanicola sp. HF7]|uniref:hypothetical protein n=1 Tax=Pseudooceanicola sp. HF7 TaxID=2721560 RepID=UPI0014311F1B|nr:hypothetical protein [Pseudooceanicola sp. HF7]NIZ08755.1 hypothetical protein [Pseudooceanicola sp. HF7]
MFGIVLWRSGDENTAVIWCEDQGDLAFFRSKSGGRAQDEPSLEQGDLLQFDVSEFGEMRLVENPRLIAQEHYPSLAARLKEAGKTRQAEPIKRHGGNQVAANSGAVIQFPNSVKTRDRVARRLRMT